VHDRGEFHLYGNEAKIGVVEFDIERKRRTARVTHPAGHHGSDSAAAHVEVPVIRV